MEIDLSSSDAPVDCIPAELLTHAFQYLPWVSVLRCRLVCHRWHELLSSKAAAVEICACCLGCSLEAHVVDAKHFLAMCGQAYLLRTGAINAASYFDGRCYAALGVGALAERWATHHDMMFDAAVGAVREWGSRVAEERGPSAHEGSTPPHLDVLTDSLGELRAAYQFAVQNIPELRDTHHEVLPAEMLVLYMIHAPVGQRSIIRQLNAFIGNTETSIRWSAVVDDFRTYRREWCGIENPAHKLLRLYECTTNESLRNVDLHDQEIWKEEVIALRDGFQTKFGRCGTEVLRSIQRIGELVVVYRDWMNDSCFYKRDRRSFAQTLGSGYGY